MMTAHSFTRRACALLSALTVLLAARNGSRAAGATMTDLGELFGRSGILQDRNGDGLIDFINTRIVVGADAPAADVVAAANLAGRLGFETSAMTLPIGATDSEITPGPSTGPLILVGRSNSLVARLITEQKIALSDLKPGEGMLALVPGAFGVADAIVLSGADDRGTVAAAAAAASRLPYLWQLRSFTIGRVESDVREFLSSRSVPGATLSARAIVYAQGHDYAERLELHVRVADAQVATAVSALKEIADAHVVGKAVFTDRQADRLNYYELGALDLRVGGRNAGREERVVIPHFGPPYRNAFPENPWRPTPRPLSLSNLYTSDGLLLDTRGQDFIPDQTATTLLLDDDERGLAGAIDVAARIGMESAGVDLPLAKLVSDVKNLAAEPNPILIGRTGALIQSLGVVVPPAPGQGVVRIVPQAFGTFPAVVVTGADASGVRAAANHLAAHVPYVAKVRRGETSYDRIEDDVMQFHRLKSSAGQAAAAVTAVEDATSSLSEKALASIDVKVYTEDERPDLAKAFESRLKSRFSGARVSASAPSRYGPVPVFEETLELRWEVDEFWQRFRENVLPKVTQGSKVEIEALLSESPEVRRDVERRAREELTKAGATQVTVHVICAYKQGFSWLNDVVLPEIKGKNPKRIRIRFPTLVGPANTKWLGTDIRWLQELFPIDEMFARELGIGLDDTVFEKVDNGPTTYEVEVTDRADRKIYSATFSPRFVAQEYLRAIPTATVHVTTGGIRAKVGDQVVVDERIKTDLERFWDEYQDKFVPRMFDYVRKNTNNRLGTENQPFFRDLIMEFDMSEPDFRLNLDEERISPLDSLHEDLTFDTIDFFAILSGQQPGSRNVAPGRIMPIMHPVRAGRGATVKISLAGNATPKPRVVVAWEEKAGGKGSRSVDLTPLTVRNIETRSETVQADRVVRAEVIVDTENASAAAEAARRAEAFAQLQTDGAMRDQLAYAALDELDLGVRSGTATRLARLPLRDRAAAETREQPKTIKPEPGKAIVTWDHVIGPDELEQELIPRLRTFPEINAYVAGQTYRKRNVWAMDVMLPMEAALWSQAKASALKPVLFVTTRQHSNEISATSATMRLMELFATDPKYRQYLKKLNVVYQPMENPDGAANHQVYLKYTPTYILHGGYWSSVMRDVGSYVWDDDPLLPEALVRRKLYRQWSPDVYMNTHSYPAHEWVHTFAGYKVPWFLAFWIPRGYHINLHHINDPNYPDHAAVGDELRERIIEEVQGNPFIKATNARLIHRFEKYARRYQPDPFRLEIYKGMNILHDYSYSFEEGGVFSRDIYVSSLWGRPGGTGGGGGSEGRNFLSRYPQITVLDLGCDMPDETPSPEWLEKMAAPGQFGYLMANIKLINESRYEVKRYDEDFRDRVSLTFFRPRPIKASQATGSGGPTSSQH